EEAVRYLQALAKNGPLWGDAQLFLAMAQHRRGQEDDARAAFVKALRWIENTERVVARGGFWYWCDQVRIRRLRNEAETLIHGAPRAAEATKRIGRSSAVRSNATIAVNN